MATRRRSRSACASALAALLAVAPGGGAASPALRTCRDGRDLTHELRLPVGGGIATGRYALPARRPAGLVVFAHGYGHTASSWTQHLRDSARAHDVIAVAMDYRGLQILPDDDGDGLPESRGWNVWTGARDLLEATRLFTSSCPSIGMTALFGVSMGGNASGLALARLGRSGGDALFDHWFEVEGVVNLTETYLEARALAGVEETAARAVEDIEAETGGPIEEVPGEYRKRTVVARAGDVAGSLVTGVTIVHAVDDGLVAFNQAREMATALAAAGVPVDLFTVGRRDSRSDGDTTATGHVGSRIDEGYRSPLAGHASETSKSHIVMATAFRRLWAVMDDGERPGPYREFVVDGEGATAPPPE